MAWLATHRLTFMPADSTTLKHWLIMLCRDPYSADSLVGVTQDDWRKGRPPTWRQRLSDQTWWWQGLPMPLWSRGEVVLDILPNAPAEPPSLSYGERHEGSDRFELVRR